MATRSTAVRAPRSVARTKPKAELGRGHPAVLLTVTLGVLLLLGLVMILSASSVTSFANFGSSFMYFKKQLLWAVLGVISFVVFARLDYRRLKGVGYLLLPVVVLLLLAVLIPGVGIVAGGSARWLGAGSFAFQPSELAKIALILFAADVFSRKEESTLEDVNHTMLPMIPVLGMLALLIMLQPDMGTTMLIGFIGFGMLFVAGAPLRYILPVGALGALIASFMAFGESYRRARLLAFMDPWADPLNTGYQTIQSLIALGSGGWFGVGLGASRQKWSYIPNSHTDFIFAILGEETGLLGTLTVVGLFGFLAYLGIRIARHAPDRFGMLIATGITILVGMQALVNIGAVTASLPITGVPLPFVSFGGSSLVVSLAGMGTLVNIALQSPQRSSSKGRSRKAR